MTSLKVKLDLDANSKSSLKEHGLEWVGSGLRLKNVAEIVRNTGIELLDNLERAAELQKEVNLKAIQKGVVDAIVDRFNKQTFPEAYIEKLFEEKDPKKLGENLIKIALMRCGQGD